MMDLYGFSIYISSHIAGTGSDGEARTCCSLLTIRCQSIAEQKCSFSERRRLPNGKCPHALSKEVPSESPFARTGHAMVDGRGKDGLRKAAKHRRYWGCAFRLRRNACESLSLRLFCSGQSMYQQTRKIATIFVTRQFASTPSTRLESAE